MLIFIGVIVFITVILVSICCFIYFSEKNSEKKYADFIEKNSISLEKVREINQRYSFYPYVNLNQTHTYDNEKFYQNISCSDFLIYQLQYITKKVFDQVDKINVNKKQYQNYLNEINLIVMGRFKEEPSGRLKKEKLLEKEKAKIEKITYKNPIMQFSITVTLYCATMNGRVYDKKSKSYSVQEIFSFVNRLKNKKGSFYNDQGIWDSLCRVERGKVSNKMRFSIYERDGHKCRCCGISERYADLEIDHIVPIAKGGKTTYDNLQTLCHKCNYEKGDSFYY